MLTKGDRVLAGMLDSEGNLTCGRVPCTVVEVKTFKNGQSARVRSVQNGRVRHVWVQDRFLFPSTHARCED